MFRLLGLFLFSIPLVWAKPLKVEVKAPAAILINADTGAVLYEKASHERFFPASITKIATALYVLEKYGHRLDEVVAASSQALSIVYSHEFHKHPPYRLQVGGTHMSLRVGEQLPVISLLYGLMLASGNDAANVLAETVSGSIDRFMKDLNSFLRANGIQETQFVNPHGLHHEDHWTTAADMAAMTRLALKHPTFREIVKTIQYVRPQTNKQPQSFLFQKNRLLKQGNYFYPKAIGVKTGYHAPAGFTLVSAATHEGRTLIAVLLKCEDTHQRFREAIKLFEAAFSEKLISRVLFAKGADQFSHQIPGAASKVQGVLNDDLKIEYYPAEEPELRAEIHWNSNALPIKKDDQVGYLRITTSNGSILQQQPIYASHAVNRTVWAYLKDHKGIFMSLFLAGQVLILLFYFFKKHQKVIKG